MQSSQEPILVLPLEIQPLVVGLLLDLLGLFRLSEFLLLRSDALVIACFSLVLHGLFEVILDLFETHILLFALILLLLLGLLHLGFLLDD